MNIVFEKKTTISFRASLQCTWRFGFLKKFFLNFDLLQYNRFL